MSTRTVALASALLLGLTAACLDDGITGTRPLTLSISADVTTPIAGQDVTVSYIATGTGLRRVAITFGDGQADSVNFITAVIAEGTFIHSYAAPGSYTVIAEANAFEGTLVRDLQITVN